MNKYVARATLMLFGEIALWAFVLFVVYLLLAFAPVQFIVYIFFFLAMIAIVAFVTTFVGIAKDWVVCKARELAEKDGFKDGIYV